MPNVFEDQNANDVQDVLEFVASIPEPMMGSTITSSVPKEIIVKAKRVLDTLK